MCDVDSEKAEHSEGENYAKAWREKQSVPPTLTSREPASAPIFHVVFGLVVKPRILSIHSFLGNKGRKDDSNYTQASKPVVARSQ